MQTVVDAEARLITVLRRNDHITPTLCDTLHRLPVSQRITFKIALKTYDSIRGPPIATVFLWRLWAVVSVVVNSRLRSADRQDTILPRTRTVRFGRGTSDLRCFILHVTTVLQPLFYRTKPSLSCHHLGHSDTTALAAYGFPKFWGHDLDLSESHDVIGLWSSLERRRQMTVGSCTNTVLLLLKFCVCAINQLVIGRRFQTWRT